MHEIIVALLIIRNQTSGILFVRPSSYGHLDDIHDVQLTDPQNGDILVYNTEQGVWKNQQPATQFIGAMLLGGM
jgi:hypothetical protein